MVRPWSCLVIYYFDAPTFGRRHQCFGRVMKQPGFSSPKQHNFFLLDHIMSEIGEPVPSHLQDTIHTNSCLLVG